MKPFSSILYEINSSRNENDHICEKHKTTLELLCFTCNSLICYKCAATLVHKKHDHISIDEIKKSFSKEIEVEQERIDDRDVSNLQEDEEEEEFDHAYYNEFKEKMFSIWGSMKIESEQHKQLTDKEIMVKTTFEELHNIISSKEYKMISPLVDLKKKVSDSIDTKLKEIQSLYSFINCVVSSIKVDSSANNDDTTGISHEIEADYKYSISQEVIQSIYHSDSLNQFKTTHNSTIFHNTLNDTNNNNPNEIDNISILRLVQYYFSYYNKQQQKEIELIDQPQQDDDLVSKEILLMAHSIKNLKINPDRLEHVKNCFKQFLHEVEETEDNTYSNSEITSIISNINNTTNVTNQINISANNINISASSTSIGGNNSNNLSCSTNSITNDTSFSDNELSYGNDIRISGNNIVNYVKQSYIFSLGFDGSISLINLSNSSIELIGKISELNGTFNSVTVAGEYIYIFGGKNDKFTRKYQIFSLRKRKLEFELEMAGVAGAENISTCFSGNNSIYLVGGYCRNGQPKYLTRIDRYNINTKNFEKCGDLGRSGYLSYVFFHRGLLYICSGFDGKSWYQSILTFNPMNYEIQTVVERIGFTNGIRSMCFDGIDFVYLIDDSDNFLRVSLNTGTTIRLPSITKGYKVTDYYSMVYDQPTNRIFVLCGQDNRNHMFSVEYNTWTSIDHKDTTTRFECGAVIIDC